MSEAPPDPQPAASRGLWAAVLGFVVVAATAGYFALGAPPKPLPAAPPAAEAPSAADIEKMVTGLAARLEFEPNDEQGWMMLARSYLVLDRPADALRAFERLVPLRPGDDKLVAAIGELKQIVAARAAEAPAAPTAAASAASAPAPRGSVSGRVELAAALKDKLPKGATLFVYAYAVDGPRMPLAVLRRPATELPLDFTLDDSLAMSPALRISIAAQVIVGARVSASGQAIAQPGDLQGRSDAVPLGTRGLRIEIKDLVPAAPAK